MSWQDSQAQHGILLSFRRRIPYVLIAAVLTLVFALVYLPRAAVGPQNSDGAELATAAVTGEVIHPPGYPVYHRLASYVVQSREDVAYHTLAKFSAMLQALAVGMLFLVSYLLCRHLLLSLAIAIAWGLYSPTLHTATDTEVFALHHFLVGVVLFACVWFGGRGKLHGGLLFLLGILCGLAGAHHQTIIFWAPVVIGLTWTSNWYLFARRLGFLVTGSIIGLSPYLLLFSVADGVFAAPADLHGLMRYILRLDYGTFSLGTAQVGSSESYITHFLRLTIVEAPLFVISLFLVLLAAIRSAEVQIFGFALSAGLHMWFASQLIVPANEAVYGEWVSRFYGLVGYAGAVCVAATYKVGWERYHAIPYLLIACLLIPVSWQIGDKLETSDASGDRVVEAEIKSILLEVPSNGVFIATVDRIAMGLHYAQSVQRRRSDMTVVVPGLIKKRHYRSLLERRLGLENLGESDLPSLVARLHKLEMNVSSYREVEPPPGVRAIPVGVTYEWLPVHEALPSMAVVARRIANFCRGWPDLLQGTSRGRTHSRYVVGRVFMGPLIDFIRAYPSAEYSASFRRVLKLYAQGDLDGSRSVCAELSMLGAS